jgi:hypothetical protein
MAESKVNRLRLRRRFVYNTGATTGRKFYHMGNAMGDLIPDGYRVVTARWWVEEDAPTNVSFPNGEPQVHESGTQVFFDWYVDALPAYVGFEVVVERSDEPDVLIDYGTQVEP